MAPWLPIVVTCCVMALQGATADVPPSLNSVEDDIMALGEELETMEVDLDVNMEGPPLLSSSASYEKEEGAFCTGNTHSGRVCPMRGGVFRDGDMREAVMRSIDQEWPGFFPVIAPCYTADPPPYCSAPKMTPVVEQCNVQWKAVMQGRVKALKKFFEEFQAKGKIIADTIIAAHNVQVYQDSKPAKYQVKIPPTNTRYWQQINVYATGKMVVQLSNLALAGLKQVGQGIAAGLLALFVPLASYAAGLLFSEYTRNSDVGLGMQKMIHRIHVGLEKNLIFVQQLLERKELQFKEKKYNFIDTMKAITGCETTVATWWGRAMGDHKCLQSHFLCDFLTKSHRAQVKAGKESDQTGMTMRSTSGGWGKFTVVGENKADFEIMSQLIRKGDKIVAMLQKGDNEHMETELKSFNAQWMGLTSKHGSVSLQASLNGMTNSRADAETQREELTIKDTIDLKDSDAELDFAKCFKQAFEEVVGEFDVESTPFGQEQIGPVGKEQEFWEEHEGETLEMTCSEDEILQAFEDIPTAMQCSEKAKAIGSCNYMEWNADGQKACVLCDLDESHSIAWAAKEGAFGMLKPQGQEGPDLGNSASAMSLQQSLKGSAEGKAKKYQHSAQEVVAEEKVNATPNEVIVPTTNALQQASKALQPTTPVAISKPTLAKHKKGKVSYEEQ